MSIHAREGQEQGSSLVGIAFVLAILATLMAVALPAAGRLYRSALVEYETQRFVSEVRYVQRLSRTTEDRDENGWMLGASGVPELHVLEAENRYVRVSIGGTAVLRYHKVYRLAKGVRLQLISAQKKQGLPVSVRFTSNGLVNQENWERLTSSQPGYTFHIFLEDYPEEGSYVIIDRAGRIRVERTDSPKT